jgi:hypothetical protein
MFSHAIDALQSYMIRADQLHPFTNPQPIPFHAGADSQGSFDVANVDFERQMMIYVCSSYDPNLSIAMLIWTAYA